MKRPFALRAAASILSHAFASSAIGFSQSTWNPAASAFSAIAGWSGVGSVMSTTSNPPAASIASKSS